MMWRHGDVLIARVQGMPGPGMQRSGSVLVHGEKTGHSHRLEDPDAGQLWVSRGRTFLEVTAEQARIVHQEHAPITLPRGIYHVWQQREYTPGAIVTVQD